jgi:hypothetical protein
MRGMKGMYRRGIAGMKRVYFMLGDQTAQVKIGMSNDPWRRSGQISSPARPIVLLYTDYTPSCGDLEASIHKQFAAQRIRGEWFNCTGPLKQFVLDCLSGTQDSITYSAGPWGSKSQIGFSYRNALALQQLQGIATPK